MKKLFTILAAALISVSAMAVDGVNIFASGLKKVAVNDNKMTIDYVLNTPATSLEVEFFDADNEIVALVEIEDAALLTEGKHRTTIDLPVDDLEEGTFSWAIHAYAGETVFENKLPVGDPRYSFYLPQDVVVDNSFESDFFGNIYVSMPWEGEDDGGTVTTQNQKRGLFVLDPTLQTVNGGDAANVGYDGGLGGDIHARNGIKRLAVDEQGFVYVASRDEETKGVYRANPADLAQPFVTVLAASAGVDGVEVLNGKLYTVEGTDGGNNGTINAYDLSAIPVGEPTKSVSAPEKMLANTDLSIRSDRRGGFWAVQYRFGLDMWPAIVHMDKKFNVNYYVNNESNPELLSNANGNLSSRGALGVNLKGDLLALSSNKEAVVFSVDFNEDGVPTLTKLCETPVFGTNVDGIAFDVADNLYVASASIEQFHLYPIAKEAGSNHSRVFAASKYNVTVGEETPEEIEHLYLIGDFQQPSSWTPNAGMPLTKTATNVFEGDFTVARNNISYFAFVTEQSDDWTVVNAHRFGGAIQNELVTIGSEADVAAGELCFTINDGAYHFVVDLNQMKFIVSAATAVEQINTNASPVKLVRDGQVIIIRNGVEFNLLGTQVK